MTIFQWDDALSSGIECIDRQHHEIIEAANTFIIQHKCGKEKAAVLKCLRFLQNYIMYHFQAEEAFQSECAYPKYRRHQALHKSLATQVKFLAVKLEESDFSQENAEQFYVFLTGWIVEHVMTEDLDFAKYYHAFHEQQHTGIPQ